MNNLTHVAPKVELIDNRAMTTSREIAKVFGKRHSDVLRAIKALECSVKFNQRNFALVQFLDAKGEMRPEFQITKDGFSFLAMGFTGKQAAVFKESYIDAFNHMAEILQHKHDGLFIQLARNENMLLTATERASQAGRDLRYKHDGLFIQLARNENMLLTATERASQAGRDLRYLGKVVKPELKAAIRAVIEQIQPDLLEQLA